MLKFLSSLFGSQGHKWHQLDKALRVAFEKVRADTRLISSWIKYLKEKDSLNDKNHEKISYQMGQHEAMLRRLISEIDALKASRSEKSSGSVRTWFEPKSEPAKRTRFERRVLAKIRPRKRDYVLEQVLKLAETGKYSTKDVENFIVDEKGLCGRTSFYSYLKELRNKKLIRDESVDGRKIIVNS